MKRYGLRRIGALLLAVVMLTTSCGQMDQIGEELTKRKSNSLKDAVMNLIKTEGDKIDATTISLTKTEGTVNIATDEGKELPPVEGLKLYSGYGMTTQAVSYAWINLDRVKLVKMDEASDIDIQQKDKDLEIDIHAGALYFQVSEPLEDDETMNIRTSSMIVGIRGTCGWVNMEDENRAQVYILEGRVSASVPDTEKELSVGAGEMAEISLTEEGGSKITLEDFSVGDIPGFIMEELQADEELAGEILDASGLDVMNPPEDTAAEDEGRNNGMLEAYKEVIARAATYFDEDLQGELGYSYALVQMHSGDSVPTLLLKKTWSSYYESVRIFQYDPDSETMYQPEEELLEGVASAGGFRGVLKMSGDGNGILSTSWYSGTGEASAYQVTMENHSLNQILLWEGRIDRLPEEIDGPAREIEWYDAADTSVLDNWTAPEDNTVGMVMETNGAADETTAAPLTDGNRIVFGGTINLYTYDQVIALQGSPDPNGPWSDTSATFRLIVLDAPQTMALNHADPTSNNVSGTVTLIDVTGAPGLAQYDGQHHTFSIDGNTTYWPSDTSLPLGHPRTNDVHVLD